MAVQDRRIGLVFQSYALFKHMTVAENIAFGPRVRKFDIDIDARCCSVICVVASSHMLDGIRLGPIAYVHRYSAGRAARPQV